jgi:hypothetical protein
MEGLTVFIKKLVECFTKENLNYAFTGALAASFYGVPRTTADIDVFGRGAPEKRKIQTRHGTAQRRLGSG